MAGKIETGRGPYQKSRQKPAKTAGLQRSKGLRASSALKRREGAVRAKKDPKPMVKRNRKRKPPATAYELCHLRAVRSLPCMLDGVRSQYVEAHHCFHDRAVIFKGRKATHFQTIPLHDRWHRGAYHTDGLPIHGNKRTWAERFGADHAMIGSVMVLIYGKTDPSMEEIEAHWESHPWLTEFKRRTTDGKG